MTPVLVCFLSTEHNYLSLDVLKEDVVGPASRGGCLIPRTPTGRSAGRSAAGFSVALAGASAEHLC